MIHTGGLQNTENMQHLFSKKDILFYRFKVDFFLIYRFSHVAQTFKGE